MNEEKDCKTCLLKIKQEIEKEIMKDITCTWEGNMTVTERTKAIINNVINKSIEQIK